MHDKWSYEQLPIVQRIINTLEKTSTLIIPAELILNNSIRLSNRILLPPGSTNPSSQIALSDTMDNWVARKHTLLTATYSLSTTRVLTEFPVHSYALFIPPLIVVTNSYPNITDHSK